MLVRRATWDKSGDDDPSIVLSPYTRERLRAVACNAALEICYGVDVVRVSKNEHANFTVHSADGREWVTPASPILGTGFLTGGGARQVESLWSWDDDGRILLSDNDESLLVPGLFLVGPQVQHDTRIYCFIYKFRQRFARIARLIANQLDLGVDLVEGSSDGVWGPFGNSECCAGCEC